MRGFCVSFRNLIRVRADAVCSRSHSGKFGSIGFLNGVMGMANGQRTMNYLRVLTEFINQPEYRNVIPMFGIINEAQANVIGDEVIRA